MDFQIKPQNPLKLIHGKIHIEFWKIKKIKQKKSYFWPFTSGWSIGLLVSLLASDLDFHFLANGRSDGDLYVKQILLNITVYVQL